MTPTVAGRRAGAFIAALLLALVPGPKAAESGSAPSGRKIFNNVAQPPCGVCHTLQDAGATGKVGPSLDDLTPTAHRVAAAVRSGVGAMPAYADTLTAKQIEAVAKYVASAAR